MKKLADIDLLQVGHSITLAGAIYMGPDGMMLVFFPDCLSDGLVAMSGRLGSSPLETLALDQGEWERFLRQTDTLETTVSARAQDGTIVKAIARKCERQIENNVTWRVFKRDGYRCRYCGADDVPLSVDHLVVWEEGGVSVEANLVACCKKCNKVRGNTPYAEWLKHPRYLAVSKGLSEERRAANLALVATLDAIPRTAHVRRR